MPKSVKISLLVVVSIIILSVAFGAGCILRLGTSASGPDVSLINQAWNIITQYYVEPSTVEAQTLNEGAVRGLVQSLNDPYSAYLNAEDYQLTQGNLQGSFEGIGAQVATNRDNEIIIVAPLEGSPAAMAGIKTGDVILAVNDVPTQGMSLTEVVMEIRGQAGTSVKLLILHEDEDTPVEIEVVRAQISSTTVTYAMRGTLLYIKITSFNERTNEELQAAFDSVDLSGSTGIILDLRDNPGGIVTTVVNVASHFIGEGEVIITLRDNQGRTESQSTNPNGTFTDLPMVVLVNEYSASGSEVLSGALQDYGRATIAGAVTLGKGSYDTFFSMEDGSAIYLTVGRWLTPKGREIEGEGITPDYTLTQEGDEAIQWAEDFLNKTQ